MEDYKEKYEQALERAKNYREGHTLDVNPQAAMEYVFPELAESEDEKIRKEILNVIHQLDDNTTICGRNYDFQKWISWLEKQGEQKLADLPKGEDYGIDSLYHAARILEKTLGDVEGYQSDDGILEHKCAIESVKSLCKQKPTWSEGDERIYQCLIEDQGKALNEVKNDKYGHSEIISDLKEMYRERIDWLKSLKERVKGE